MEELGHTNYFDLLDEFAKEIVEAGQAGDVKEFFDGLENGSQQMEAQIDEAVYDLFELIDEERETIEEYIEVF